MPHKSPVCGHILRFDGAFLRSKTGSFFAPEKANSFLFNRSLASFHLFNIFFKSSVYFPRRPGRFSNLFRASCSGVLHRSTIIAYHDSRLVSRANAGVRSQEPFTGGKGLQRRNGRRCVASNDTMAPTTEPEKGVHRGKGLALS